MTCSVGWRSLGLACLLCNGCNQKQDQVSGSSITVELPSPRPRVSHAPEPGFSDEALAPSFEEPPTPLDAPAEQEESKNSS
jgi:hypothetical protein